MEECGLMSVKKEFFTAVLSARVGVSLLAGFLLPCCYAFEEGTGDGGVGAIITTMKQ